MTIKIYDFIAIGLGPFNLGLACLTAPVEDLDGLFLEKNSYFNWHPGMLLSDSTLQTPFIGDLVTLADPTSRYSFLNYIKSQGRIYSFYIKEDFFLIRREFNQYCQWASRQMRSILFDRFVDRVEYDEGDAVYVVHTRCTRTGVRARHRGRRLVLGTGTTPFIPACCQGATRDVSHTASYLDDKKALQRKRSITIVGSGQSAAEVFHDLLLEADKHGYALNWVTRSPRFFPLDLSKLTLEMTSPDYADYFHTLDPDTRDSVLASQKSLYKGIDKSLIDAIYDRLYKTRLHGGAKVLLQTNTELREVESGGDRGLKLGLYQAEQRQAYEIETDAVVLGTGYTYAMPRFLEPIEHRIRWDDRGRFAVARNYSIDADGSEIFVQNAELHTHGFVAPDLGMASYRNACIIRAMLGREPYRIEETIAFQSFAAPTDATCPSEPALP